MPLDNSGSPPVRPATEISSNFEGAVCAALAPLDQLIVGVRRRAEAIAGARRAILAAADVALKAERRRVVQMTTSALLRNQILALVELRWVL
jgi:hypothetical protein